MTDLSSVSHSARVLYVDDDAGIARLVKRTLEARGFSFEHANSADAAMTRLDAGAIDIVALDHHMPGKSGLDILPGIRALANAPPVVFVTGSEDSRVAVSALKAGAADYVFKDIDGHFRDLLAEALGTSLAQERLRREKDQADREIREGKERAELLLREVNHRVANSLAIVGALCRMQATTMADPAAKTAFEDMQARVIAIAGVHRRLYTSDNVQIVEIAPYLQGLLEELESTFHATGREHPIVLKADPVTVPTDQAVSIGVIVTELITNAYKYAYGPGAKGDIRVRVVREGSDVALSVEDDGIGWHGNGQATGSGLGSRIVAAMASSLQSSVVHDPDHKGTRVSIRFAVA